ncbi:MAG TPA: carboxy terminal-processing peptidase, partial [Candidatus Acidoferrum sp.]|nr:carboxy terminal-processing peptidase [Candidatus Acidoferrum sp.]
MIERFAVSRLPLLLGCILSLPFYHADAVARTATADTVALAEASLKSTNAFHPLAPGPVDGQIAYVTARMLEQYHYLRQPLNTKVSGKFLDRYLDLFDPAHVHFTQGDLAEFEVYRTNLDHLTINQHRVADTRPACVIFNRFVQRLQQHVAYVDELLKTEKFTFDTDERILLNRKDRPYPKDLDAARTIWRDRLRFEYLQEKLGKIDARAKAAKGEPAARDNGTNASSAVEKAAETKPKKPEAEEIVETLTHRYHRNLRYFLDWDSDDVLQTYLTALARVYDPHSDYFGHSQLDSFAITMNLSLFGIGAELMSEDGYCVIHRLLPGGPAAKGKVIKENDRIIAVAQSNQPPVDVVDMSLNKAVQLIRGPKGTEVRLTIIPAGADSSARKTITLVRDEIKLEDQEAKAKLIEMPSGHGQNVRLGVIDLPSFYASFDPSNNRGKAEPRSTTADVSLLLNKLKQEHVDGVILDLRRNGGGSLEEAIKLTGLFIKDGPVVQVRDFDGSVQEDDDTDPSVLYDGPLVVMTSRFSASASEILAGALQDYGRALIVGDSSTHGKGTVQSVQPLKPFIRGGSALTNDPGALKLTIKKFYRASGASTQLKGVVPDIVLPSIFNESKDIGEAALENPLPWDTIESSKFQRLDLVAPYTQELRRRSSARIASDKEYSYIREDIEFFKKQQADKTVSLNEQQRLKEKEEIDARNKARDKERLARVEPSETVYDL